MTSDDKILKALLEVTWQYADKDPYAISELTDRISETGRKFALISYSDLVRGVDFHYPNINDGDTYWINTYDWSGLDRRIIGDCLGFISMKSFEEAGFMARALVIARLESKPSDIFLIGCAILMSCRTLRRKRYWRFGRIK